jgi:hypothetical protein
VRQAQVKDKFGRDVSVCGSAERRLPMKFREHGLVGRDSVEPRGSGLIEFSATLMPAFQPASRKSLAARCVGEW